METPDPRAELAEAVRDLRRELGVAFHLDKVERFVRWLAERLTR